uniref:Tumor necrosis factor receptor superfamily member 13C-like n=1 Tax=Sinocyclocheilus anshuiensis TaxID=1608454 RepID=A0A671P5S6_9TELE
MERRACPPGSQWDSLLKHCISHRSLGLTPSGLDESWSSISPSVWICVGLVVSVSVLVLLLWFIIYRLLSICPAGEKDSTPHTPTTIEQEEEAPSPWPHFNGQTQEMPIKEGPCGRSLCNGWAEHGLPLPATELGNSALVTTKTGQPV